MINCISYAITLDHRMCIQNRLAELLCLKMAIISLSPEALGYHLERYHHLSCLISLEVEGKI